MKTFAPVVLVAFAACVGTEAGNPPFTPEPVNPDPGVDLSLARGVFDPGGISQIEIRIPVEALDEGVTGVRVTPLQGDALASDLALIGDTYVGNVDSLTGLRYRVQVVVAAGRLAPVDVEVAGRNNELRPIPRALDCVRFEGRDVPVSAGAAVDVRLRNDCDDPVEIVTQMPRLGDRVSILTPLPTTVNPGEVAAATVTAGEGFVDEDLLLLSIAQGAQSDLVPVTLFAP